MPKKTVAKCFAQIMEHWSRPQKSNSTCNQCPLWHHESSPVFGVGNRVDPKVVAIAESPFERKPKGTPDFGRINLKGVNRDIEQYWNNAENSGIAPWVEMCNAFDEIFSGLPNGKESVYLTNIWRCTNKKRADDEKSRSFDKCSHHLTSEILSIRPRLVVTFGREALDRLVWTIEDRSAFSVNSIRDKIYTKPHFSQVEGNLISLAGIDFKILPAFHWSWGEFFSMPRWNGNYRPRIKKLVDKAIGEF